MGIYFLLEFELSRMREWMITFVKISGFTVSLCGKSGGHPSHSCYWSRNNCLSIIQISTTKQNKRKYLKYLSWATYCWHGTCRCMQIGNQSMTRNQIMNTGHISHIKGTAVRFYCCSSFQNHNKAFNIEQNSHITASLRWFLAKVWADFFLWKNYVYWESIRGVMSINENGIQIKRNYTITCACLRMWDTVN